MHPPLVPEKHPICSEAIKALVECHKEHSVSKWWGACNDAKFALSRCLAAEKKELRAERQARAKAQFREKQERDRLEREERQRRREQEGQGQQQQQQQAGAL